jgi:O-antigen/teichoic acid export membrane protein
MGGLAAGLMAYAYHFVAGRMLGRAAYGELASLVAAVYLLSLPTNVVSTISMRFAAEAHARRDAPALRALLRRLTILMLGLGALLCAVLLVGRSWIAQFLGITGSGRIGILALAAALWLLLPVNRGILQGMQRFGFLSTNLVLDATVRVGLCAMLLALGYGVPGAVLALVLGPLIAYGHSFLGLRGLLGGQRGRAVSGRRLGAFALPATVGLLGITYLFNIDVILAKHYLTPDAAGTYAAGAVLGRVVYFASFSIAGVMFPEVATLHARNQRHFPVVELSLGLVVALAVPITLVYAFLPGLVVLPFGKAFTPVTQYLLPFALAFAALSVSNLLISYYLSVGERRFVPALLLACLLEPAWIVAFHASVGQLVGAVLGTNVVLLAVLSTLYLWHRFGLTSPGPDAAVT